MFRTIAAMIMLMLHQPDVHGWGFHAHRLINRMACFTLPPSLFAFYKPNIDYLEDHAPDPDRRRYTDPDEAPRHYLDVDHYHSIDAIPFRFDDAACMYGKDTVLMHGTVPWTIQIFYYRLVDAFSRKDVKSILRYSAFLGHYVGDAHVPLHCTSNYDGQLTGQRGIHSFWESRLPELFSDDYWVLTNHASYRSDPLGLAWEIVRESASAVDSVLRLERGLDSITRSDRKYAWEERGSRVVKTYSVSYSEQFHAMLQGQVERRMAAAVYRVGTYWYSAWVDAGQPDLPGASCIFEEESESDTMVVVTQLRDCGH